MSVRVELELATGDFTSGMLRAGQSVRQFQQSVGAGITSVRLFREETGSMLQSLRDVTVTAGLARAAIENIRAVTTGWAGDIIKVNAEMEKLGFLLRGMSNAADPVKDAGKQIQFLRDTAKDAPFQLKELTDVFVKMKSTGLDPMAGGFKAMIDGVAAFGGTDDVLKRATVAISQMAGKGVIQMEELRQQLGEAMPRAVEIMARSMGMSTGQLINEISKGTLEAKNALSAFFTESERTFGGAAAQQMQTFNGRLSQMSTLIQGLAMKTGDTGYFDAVKNQLKDINLFLSGDQAAQFAGMLGRGLTSVVGGLRDAVDWMMKFHSEIIGVGEALAIAFVSRAAINGLLSLGAMMTGLTTQVRTFGVAWQAFDNNMRMADMGRVLGQVTQGAMGFTAMGYAARTTSLILPFIGVALSTIATTVVPVVGGMVAAAYAFGLFSDKAADAYENLAKFGAETRAQAQAADTYAKALEERISLLRALKQAGSGDGSVLPQDGDDDQIKGLQAKLNEVRSKNQEFLAQGTKREADREMSIQNELTADQINLATKGYDERAKAAQKAYTDQLNLMNANRQDTTELQANYNREHQQMVIDSVTAEYQVRENNINAMNQLMADGNDKALLIGDRYVKEQILAQKPLLDKLQNLAEGTMKPVSIDKGVDIGKLVEKGKARLDDLKMDISSLNAELSGASGEYAKLAYQIEEAAARSKTFGPEESVRIREVTDALRAQQVIRDQLDQAVAGRKKFDSDIEGFASRSRQALIESSTQGKSEIDKMWVGLKEGAYNGMGSIERMVKSVGDAGRDAASGLQVMFGPDMLSGANSMLTVTQQMAAHFGYIADASGRIGAGKGGLVGTGGSKFNGRSYYDNLVSNESGGDPNVPNSSSSARGYAQFTKGTWLDFMKTRPDVQGTDDEKLKLRETSKELNEDAVTWRNAMSASKLMQNKVDPNDANIYLGHFLGPDGAVAALTKSSDTLLRSIPELKGAIASNPKVFDRMSTVGDLQNWSQGKFGTAYTARTSSNSSRNVADMLSAAGGPDSPEGKKLMQGQLDLMKSQLQDLQNAKKDYLKDKALEATGNNEADNGRRKNEIEAREAVRRGKYGTNLDPDASDNADVLDAAKAADAAANTRAERLRQRQKFDASGDTQDKQLQVFDQRIAELKRQIESQGKFGLSSRYFQAVGAQEKNEQEVQKGLGTGAITPDEAAKSRSQAAELVTKQRNQDIVEAVAAEQQKTNTIEKSLMTVGEAREKQLQDDVRRNQTYLNMYQGSGAEREMVEQQVTRNIAILRRQQFDLTPMGTMLKQWRDVSNNLQTASTGWMNSFNDKLADMVVKGQASFKGLTDQILTDLVKIGLKAAESKLFSSILGGGLLGGTTGVDGLAAIHHTGGVAGASMPYRQVDMSIFNHARRWHTGTGGQTLGGDEIPIIAKRGEQVDWPQNLAKQYGGGGAGSVQFGDIHVNAGGTNGSPSAQREQAAVIAAAVREQARAMVGNELRQQMRPGGLLKG